MHGHFVVRCGFAIDIIQTPLSRPPCIDIRSCQKVHIAIDFAQEFICWIEQSFAAKPIDKRNPDEFVNLIKDAFDHAAISTLPHTCHALKKPWISSTTIDLIKQRDAFRRLSDYTNEKLFNAKIRIAAKHDRASWLSNLLESGD